MDRKDEANLLEQLLGLKQGRQLFLGDAPTSNPVSEYTDPVRFSIEQQRIFERQPLIVAHASELDGSGSFVSRTVNGKPLLILRGDDNQVRAFLNVCRHRGTRLVDQPSGCKRRYVCPYHGWTWNSRGEFLNGPHFEAGFPGVDRAELGLSVLPCVQRHGFVWLMPSEETAVSSDFFTELGADLAWAGAEHLVVHDAIVQQRRCNWKIIVEGGLEAYHFRVAHRDTIASLFNDNLSSYQTLGPHIRTVLPRMSIDDLPNQAREQWRLRDHANVLLTVFPNTSLLLLSDHLLWVAITPIDVDHSEVRVTTLKPRDSSRSETHWDKNHALSVATLDEDFDIGESIQSGLNSGANESLRFGRFEGALHRFNETVRACLA